jgi:hypothetical protein
MATKYQIKYLRVAILAGLLRSWPTSLEEWEIREHTVTGSSGLYAPRMLLPHPMYPSPPLYLLRTNSSLSLVINLAREVSIPELLPAAFYDLSRYLPSEVASGYRTSRSALHRLSQADLLRTLQGREEAARFLSTFVVNELESRLASEHCLHRNAEGGVAPSGRRERCAMAFEAVTFELVRDVNGIVCNRNSDVLYALEESLLIQTRDDRPGERNQAPLRACEACRMEYAAVVGNARRELWNSLPRWFALEVES